MKRLSLRPGLAAGLVTALALGGSAWAADAGASRASGTPSSPAASSSTASTASRTSSTTARTAKVLPDPALLDGSSQQADKKVENGMIGEFELPGDENADRNGRVGGRGGPQPQQQQQPQMSLPLPSAGIGIPGGQSSGEAGGGGVGISVTPPSGSPAGGVGAGVSLDPNAPPGADAGAGAGVQVGSLSGEADSNPQGQISSKPQPVAIGDSANQIKTVANAPGVVGGSVPSGSTQQMESRIGGAGGGQGSRSDNTNRGSEKGRAMPAGL